MKRIVLAVLICLIAALPVFAQTETPTSTPIPLFAPLASPTPLASVTPFSVDTVIIPHSIIYNNLATVESQLASAPNDLTNPGLPLLPSSSSTTLFSYAKWVFSSSAADEVFGFMSPIMISLAARFTVIPFLAIIYLIIFIVVYILKVIVWIIFKIRALLPF